jgi:hypothetical protein
MKKLPFLFFFLSLSILSIAQKDPDALVWEGVKLHDQGQYDEAIKKYDEALAINKNHYLASYEKSHALMYLEKYAECIDLCEFLLKNFPGEDNSSVYINYGNSLDILGKSKQALDIYDEGIKKYPKMALLYFNKAITLFNTGDISGAIEADKLSIQYNPYHGSSQNLLSLALNKTNKVYSLLASLVFLAIEPDGKRAAVNLKNVQNILTGNAQKTGDNSVSINIDMSSIDDKKKKNAEDDFGGIELLIGIGGAEDFEDKYKNESPVDRIQRKLETVISMLSESSKKNKGFAWTYYAPFFVQLKKADYLNTFCHVLYSSADDRANNNWMQDNKSKIDEFNSWFRNYWKTGE